MNSRWVLKDYEFIQTKDGSPTLKWLKGEKGFNGEPESMHHMGGAYSETQAIYGDVVRKCLGAGGRNFASVGLGLGYNEMLIAVESLKRGLNPSSVITRSFEADSFLISEFLKWMNGEQDADMVYGEIFNFFSRDSHCEIDAVRAFLKAQLKEGTLMLEGALGADTLWSQKYHCILYDAFSAKTSPELWEESFLENLFNKACAENCFVSSYACKSPFKRALKTNGFELTIRDGFHGKRNSTLAIRISHP